MIRWSTHFGTRSVVFESTWRVGMNGWNGKTRRIPPWKRSPSVSPKGFAKNAFRVVLLPLRRSG